jgi:hypothetical protein
VASVSGVAGRFDEVGGWYRGPGGPDNLGMRITRALILLAAVVVLVPLGRGRSGFRLRSRGS